MSTSLRSPLAILPLTLVALATAASPLAGVAANAASDTARASSVSVTIKGNDGPYGEVKSARRVCKAHVTVRVYRQVGTRGGGDDTSVGSPDTTDLQGTKWTWSIGNPGLNNGDKVYAKIKAHDGCKVAFSPTMKVHKD